MSQGTIDLFVSHRGLDRDWVQHFIDRIEQHTIEDRNGPRHIKVFYSPDIAVGLPFVDYMLEQAHRARFVLLIMTPEFFESPYTSMEVNVALRAGKLIPLLRRDHSLDGKPMTDLPFLVRDWNYIDFRDDTTFESQLAKVVALVRNPPSDPHRANAFVAWLQPILEILGGATTVETALPRAQTPRPFTTLERSFDHVVDRLVWVVCDNDTLLGCAWSWRDNRLLCAACVGEVVDEALAGGRRVEIERARPGRFSNEVKEVREVGLPNLAVLRVRADLWLPRHVDIAWSDSAPTANETGVLGAVAHEINSSRSIKQPILTRLSIIAHGEVTRLDDFGLIASGTPLFDCSGRLVGFISKKGALELSMHPFQMR